jgi:hypothetical protein
MGHHPAGASYRILSLIGHGAKIVDVYTFGPYYLFTDGWSENFSMYPSVAQAIRLLGRAERVLFPGHPERGKVAILVPSSSALWDSDQNYKLYQDEASSLHTALVHAGFTIDFVDAVELAKPDFALRGYTTLYLTAPNVMARAQENVRDWVANGGVLAVTVGAAVRDEYNTPTDILDVVLGVSSRSPARGDAVPLGVDAVLSVTDPRFRISQPRESHPELESETLGIRRKPGGVEIQPLTVNGATVTVAAKLYFLSSPLKDYPAVAVNEFNKGFAVTYGFFPGFHYEQSPDRTDEEHLPRWWDTAWRRLAVAPAIIAKTPRSVLLNREVVEACRLESDKGIGIVLLNWTDEPIDVLEVIVPNAGVVRKISSVSVQPDQLRASVVGQTVRIELPLKDVDVLLIE